MRAFRKASSSGSEQQRNTNNTSIMLSNTNHNQQSGRNQNRWGGVNNAHVDGGGSSGVLDDELLDNSNSSNSSNNMYMPQGVGGLGGDISNENSSGSYSTTTSMQPGGEQELVTTSHHGGKKVGFNTTINKSNKGKGGGGGGDSEGSAAVLSSTGASTSAGGNGNGFLHHGSAHSSTTRNGGRNSNGEEEPLLAQKESADVSRWRLAVCVMLLITAGLVLTSTYVFLSREEQNEFNQSFSRSANTVIEASYFYAFNVIETYETLADSITSEVLNAHKKPENYGEEGDDEVWPFVTPYDFEVRAAHARISSYTETVYFVPVIFNPFRDDWERYSVNNTQWIHKSREQYETITKTWLEEQEYFDADIAWKDVDELTDDQDEDDDEQNHFVMDDTLQWSDPTSPDAIVDKIYRLDHDDTGICLQNPETCTITKAPTKGFYAPIWMISPPPDDLTALNFDLLSDPVTEGILSVLINVGTRSMITSLLDLTLMYKGVWSKQEHSGFHRTIDGNDDGGETANQLPHSLAVTSIRAQLGGEPRTVGFIAGVIPWDIYFSRLLPPEVNGVYVVLKNSCGSISTYVINGPTATYLGDDDLHEKEYDYTEFDVDFNIFGSVAELDGTTINGESLETCEYSLSLYASSVYRKDFESSKPEIFTVLLAAVFLATGLVFIIYVQYVQRRQAKVMETALRTNAIVSSLFPSNVRDRILRDVEQQAERAVQRSSMAPLRSKQRLQSFLQGNTEEEEVTTPNALRNSRPIADLFPSCTVMICDIVGFTAWSSVRQPADVFQLLETVYHAFDERAKRRRVYKVETVGDQYVAVAGLPEPRKDNAVVMARFAQECCEELEALVKQLEVIFGPDTGDLSMRFGLHSGPVTAGVLRGERARFQLFGDTVNTAARLESTGVAGKIQVSSQTAELLSVAGKAHWVTLRDERVVAKGKGELQTYWLNIRAGKQACVSSVSGTEQTISETSSIPDSTPLDIDAVEDKTARLVDWNVDMLLRLLRQMAARRTALGKDAKPGTTMQMTLTREEGNTVLDEVREIITLPRFDAEAAEREVDASSVGLDMDVEKQLREYVSIIARMYHDNPFHNFEHVSHVAMSVAKLLSRIVAPSDLDIKDANQLAHTLHDHTYGITSDPLTQFACIFSALIHDVDHKGVPNTQLIKEDVKIAAVYKNKSVAEQNSVDLSWDLLMMSRFGALQNAIFATDEEFRRFRQLVVNSVMATDIMDKDLKALRNARWDKAFKDKSEESSDEQVNRKATIVIEHLIQASDVSHTMQHWHVYRKWNARLFREMYKAFKEGRAEKNPADFWAKGEIGFFDFYIIPLAKKLKDCGVFGVSSFEYLDYAQRNRDEWESKGEQIVAEMLEFLDGPETQEPHIEESMFTQEHEDVHENGRVVI